jgi:hypothetical protein
VAQAVTRLSSCAAPQTQGFLAYRAAFAKPFSAATAADLVSSLPQAGPNMLNTQPDEFYAEMQEVS